MKLRLTLVVLMLMAAMILGFANPNTADAVCGIRGKIFYMYATPTVTYFYVNYYGYTLPTFYYYFSVPNTTAYTHILSALNAAYSGNQSVFINGSAASCPTTGLARYGGAPTYVYAYSSN